MPDPVLVVDAGGTLMTRTRPGLATRVAGAVAQAKGADAIRDSEVRRVVLTAPDSDACVRALDLPDSALRSAVAAVLSDDPGDAVLLPGAEDLLRAATELGWRVILATNAGPGTPALPDRLARYITSVVESRTCGMVKEDPRFWEHLIQLEGLDPRMTLVVGDDDEADRVAPAVMGLQSRRPALDGSGLAGLAADLRAAGSVPLGAVAVVAGDREPWGKQTIVPAPHLQSLVARITRARVRFVAGDTFGSAAVVRRRGRPPAVVDDRGPLPGVAWLLQAEQRRPYTVPAGLERLLAEKDLSLDVLSSSERRHALAMIREARAEETVNGRIADLVHFLEERTEREASA